MKKGELVWFDPGCGYLVPGELVDFNFEQKQFTIQSNFAGKVSDKFVLKISFPINASKYWFNTAAAGDQKKWQRGSTCLWKGVSFVE